jgi:hypothetical protein
MTAHITYRCIICKAVVGYGDALCQSCADAAKPSDEPPRAPTPEDDGNG